MFKFTIVFIALVYSTYAQTTTTTVPTVSTTETTRGPRPTLPPELQEKVCRDLIPLHPGSPGPQNTTAPYRITPASPVIANGERMFITIEPSVAGKRFNGFMVQARLASDYKQYQVFGTWIVDAAGLNDAQSCISFNDTAFSDSPESWDRVNLVWQAPLTGSGEVIFFASLTENFVTFWIDLFSVFPVKYGSA